MKLESLFDASSLQQAVMRTYYLQVFADRREQDLSELQNKKNELSESKSLLKREMDQKLTLLKTRDDEKISIDKKNSGKEISVKIN